MKTPLYPQNYFLLFFGKIAHIYRYQWQNVIWIFFHKSGRIKCIETSNTLFCISMSSSIHKKTLFDNKSHVDDDLDVPDWGWCPWWRFDRSPHALMQLCLKFGWNLMSLKASRTPVKINDISRVLAGVDDDIDVPDWGLFPWLFCGWSAYALRQLCLKYGGNQISLKASRTTWKIDDICGFFTGVDDDLVVPDRGWSPWWHFGWWPHALMELCLKFGWHLMSLKASRTPSKNNDILDGVVASLMMFWMVWTCHEGALLKIWLKSVEFKGIKNSLKDWWHF